MGLIEKYGSNRESVTLQAVRDALADPCRTCSFKCKESLIARAKAAMQPAAVVVIALIAFTWTSAFYHLVVAYDLPGQTPPIMKLFCYLLNGVICLLGIALMIMGFLDESGFMSFAIVLGFFITVGGVVACFFVLKDMKILLKVTSVGMIAMGFALLVFAMLLSIVSGGTTTVSGELIGTNLEIMQTKYEAADPQYCTYSYSGNPMPDDICRDKIRADVESSFMTVSIFGMICIGVLVTSTVFTIHQIKLLGRDSTEGLKAMMKRHTGLDGGGKKNDSTKKDSTKKASTKKASTPFTNPMA
eukprot:SAG31_NODE_5399_length_2555_cov_1.499797_5_plen_300_part_01